MREIFQNKTNTETELCQKTRISFFYQRNSRSAGGSSFHINCIVWFASKKIKKSYDLGTEQKRHFFLCLCLVLLHWKADNLTWVMYGLWPVLESKECWKSYIMPSWNTCAFSASKYIRMPLSSGRTPAKKLLWFGKSLDPPWVKCINYLVGYINILLIFHPCLMALSGT